MIAIPSISQIRSADNYTIENEPISSIDLMERASAAFVRCFKKIYRTKPTSVHVICGPGNNGGDGLAIARMLSKSNYPSIRVSIWSASKEYSPDFKVNLSRISLLDVEINHIEKPSQLRLKSEDILIDAVLGSGLTGPLREGLADVVGKINRMQSEVIAVDVPTGFNCEDLTKGECVRATHTISFQRPKLAFFFPESEDLLGQWHIVDIGLSASYLKEIESAHQMVELGDLSEHFPRRTTFSHKGSYGWGLLVAGSSDKPGAALLAAEACLRSGIGLLTLHTVPTCAQYAVPRLPELMLSIDSSEKDVGMIPHELMQDSKLSACAWGPGLGRSQRTSDCLDDFLKARYNLPIILDADALNIISERGLFGSIPKGSIISPHAKEFDRLFGPSASWFERLEKAKEASKTSGVYIILKNAYTFSVCPDGLVMINSTGNPGLAKGGSGDVLTGMLLALRSKGLQPKECCYSAVALHGLAADLAIAESNENALLASDVISSIPAGIDKIQG